MRSLGRTRGPVSFSKPSGRFVPGEPSTQWARFRHGGRRCRGRYGRATRYIEARHRRRVRVSLTPRHSPTSSAAGRRALPRLEGMGHTRCKVSAMSPAGTDSSAKNPARAWYRMIHRIQTIQLASARARLGARSTPSSRATSACAPDAICCVKPFCLRNRLRSSMHANHARLNSDPSRDSSAARPHRPPPGRQRPVNSLSSVWKES